MPLFDDVKVARTILLEEAFATDAYMDGPAHNDQAKALRELLVDLGAGRIQAMDEAGIDVHVLSLTSPGTEQIPDGQEALAVARETNEALAAALKKHPDRFVGLAAVPTGAPELAAAELERAVTQLGCKGAIINGHARGHYLDEERFRPLLARAEALDAPLYLHPTMPPEPVMKASYEGSFSPELAKRLGGAAWGWHLETGTHVLRMILGGVFDRFPRLQLVIGHMGEALPFMLPRIERVLAGKTKRPIRAYFREHLHYTVSGFNFMSMFEVLRSAVGIDRILYSADWPYASMKEAKRFLLSLDVSQDEREQIAHGNAERLLRLT